MIELPKLARPSGLPQWKHPPLNEVAIAVQFNDVSGWSIVHYGMFAERLKAIGLVTTEDKGVINRTLEAFGKRPVRPPTFQLVTTEVPPLPRVWYKSADGHRLVQIQPDRFVYNWRKIENEGAYPRLNVVFPEFCSAYEKFREFVNDIGSGALAINQFELSYFNNIPLEEDENFHEGLSRVFRLWSDLEIAASPEGIGIEPEAGNFAATYVVNGHDEEPIARLHAQAAPAQQDDQNILRLSIIFRGPVTVASDEAMIEFFALGRQAIVRLFDNLVSDRMHKEWGRYIGEER